MNKRNVIEILTIALIMLCVVGTFIIIDANVVRDRILSDRRYMVGLDIKTDIKYGNTTFLVYDGDMLVESDNVSRTIFREDTKDYQYVCYCDEKNWTYAEASTFRFVWYDVDNDKPNRYYSSSNRLERFIWIWKLFYLA